MPKKNQNNNGKKKKPPGKGGKKGKGNTFDDIKEKAKNSRRKKVKVNLPTLYITGQSNTNQDGEEAMSAAELSYKDALLAVELEKLAAKGLKDGEIIKALGISRTSFYEKIRDEPYFSYSLRKHRGMLIHQVKNALAQNALGFTYLEQQGTAMGEVVTVMKQKLPETKAQEIILYNLDRENYKKTPEPPLKEADDISNVNIQIKRRVD